MSDRKTVRVRIALAVDSKGRWSACGWVGDSGRLDDEEYAGHAQESLDSGLDQLVHFIEADVPLPTSETIQGEVKP
jgi:hypothetical protein